MINFLVLLLVIFVVKLFFFFGIAYFILDFRSINFFMVTKMRKMLKLQAFLKKKIINY